MSFTVVNKMHSQSSLPLDTENWIVSGNALRLNWLKICPHWHGRESPQ